MSKFIISEYDAFGPWIYIISESHPIPPLLIEYLSHVNESLMSFKIPRNIERRQANPNIHLYDRLICIKKTHMLVVQRDENKLVPCIIDYCDIQTIRRKKVLLHGELEILTSNKTITIEYNTVSDNIISNVIDKILILINSPVIDVDLEALSYDIIQSAIFLQT